MARSSPVPLLQFDSTTALREEWGLPCEQLVDCFAKWEAVRQKFLQSSPAGRLDQLPEEMLLAYRTSRHRSELGRILIVAHDLRNQVDRVVVLGSGGFPLAAQALMGACCEPDFNELTRGERGCHPRVHFLGDSLDNDVVQGVLQHLGRRSSPHDAADRWALVVLGTARSSVATQVLLQPLLSALRINCGGNEEQLRSQFFPVVAASSPLAELVHSLGATRSFLLPEDADDRWTLFTPAGILPAAILGINVVELLEGAISLTEHFRGTPGDQNLILQYVAGSQAIAQIWGRTQRCLALWSQALEGCGKWYDYLTATTSEVAGSALQTRATYAGRHTGQSLQSLGTRRGDWQVTQVVVHQWRCDPLAVASPPWPEPLANERNVPTLPAWQRRGEAEWRARCLDWRVPLAEIRLPSLREATVGQLLQLLLLSTWLEAPQPSHPPELFA